MSAHRRLLGQVALALGVMAAAASEAKATAITTQLLVPHSTVTFEEIVFSSGTIITDQYAGLGVTFSPAGFYTPNGLAIPPLTGVDGNYIGNFNVTTGSGGTPVVSAVRDPISIFFTEQERAAVVGFGVGTATTAIQVGFQALLNGTVIESFIVNANANQPGYSGFSFLEAGFENILFDQILINPNLNNPGSAIIALDNFQFVPVPEPGTLLLLSVGGIAGFMARRKRRDQGVERAGS